MIRLTTLLGAAVAGALALGGCSGSDEGAQPEEQSTLTVPPASTGATPYLPVPDGVELTEPGSQLAVGDHAVVAYHPRQEQVGALDIAVTRLEKTSIKDFSAWQLSDAQKASTPYYVRARVENVGDTDLGGRPVPLYVVNEDNVLLEPTPFASSFQACPSTPFPEKFAPGDTARVCLVYLAPDHGDLVSVSFRPEETFNPITWSGDVAKYEAPQADQPKSGTQGKGGTRGGKADPKAGKGGTRAGKGGTRGG
ncbi:MULTISPECIES: hypothetical protein [unclassified Nocardioides]|uniref:hypothetical protein n=1 Tax=unclassified Nocardioides TaxID=2615069 RepID=UPI0002F3B72E|nr:MULTISPECIES: hypothetical protein [unclassified Nocardioides]